MRTGAPIHSDEFGKVTQCVCRSKENAEILQGKFGSVLKRNVYIRDFHNRGAGSKKMLEIGKDFIKEPVGFITVFGDNGGGKAANGNGKTTWAQALVNECIFRGVSALYVTASDLMEYVNGGIENNDVEERMRVLVSATVLVIDELTQVRWSEWVEDKLTSIIDRRYKLNYERGTLLIMDEKPKDKLHPRIVSRMREGIVIRNSDDDFRPALGQENLL